MRELDVGEITRAVKKLFISANYSLPDDAVKLIKEAPGRESNQLGRSVMNRIYENLGAAKELDIPICQDTGMAVLFVELGQEIRLCGGDFNEAVNEGVRLAYREGYLRKSVVDDPLFDRRNTSDNTPAVIHLTIVPGDKIKLTAAPKGFGSENMSAVRMLTPSAKREDIIREVCDIVVKAGGNPCPPLLLGIGIGSTFEGCALLAKKALTRDVSKRNPDPRYALLESDILEAVNKTGIGPQGFGGDVTALAVNIEYAPTHIAGLPLAVNINCHVMRHASVEL